MTGRSAGATFEAERPRLVALAYRITGSRTTADDLVQEAWIRFDRADPASIERPAAWLTTVTSRLALDHLRSARHTRETYVGPWLPEAAVAEADPAEHAAMAESVTIGFLAVLERLGPTERVVFVLADVFGLPFAEIAEVVGATPEACRQVASRARRRVRAERPRFAPTTDEAWQVAAAFMAAAEEGDLDTLVSLLAADAVSTSDGGPDHRAARRPVVGDRIARFVVNVFARRPPGATIEVREVNGQPGVVVHAPDGPHTAAVVSVSAGKVDRVWIIRNPDKLAGLSATPVR